MDCIYSNLKKMSQKQKQNKDVYGEAILLAVLKRTYKGITQCIQTFASIVLSFVWNSSDKYYVYNRTDL